MWKKILILLGIFSAVVLAVSIYLLANVANQLKNSNYLEASKTARISLSFIGPISKITFTKNNDIELLKESLGLISKLPEYSKNLVSTSDVLDIQNLNKTLESANQQIQTINNLTKKSSLSKKIVGENYLSKLKQLSKSLPDFITVLNSFSQKDQKIIIVFQNSDEIRATGGFMGSYAILDIINGKVADIIIEDIYDADGQFSGFIEAPSGIKEYLSDDKGLRLSNSNWHPDFPASAEQILQFFALGNKKNVTTLAAINPEYAKILLNIVGEITIKDYNTIVNSNNINEVLRSRRSTFFPGSKQKKHLLSQLLTQLQIKIIEANEESKLNIIKQTLNQLSLNNIQLYSTNDDIDEIFSGYDFRQELEYKNDSNYLFLVESNVGINKANKNITREVLIDVSDFENLITVNFKNNNIPPTTSILTNLIEETGGQASESGEIQARPPADHLGYVNYQRVIVKPNRQLDYIKYNDEIISEWNENIIKNSSGEKFKEIGFLITLKEQESSVLEVKFENLNKNEEQIYIQKQPGLPATPYVIKNDEFVSQVLLEKNFLVKK